MIYKSYLLSAAALLLVATTGVSGVPDDLLNKINLTQKECPGMKRLTNRPEALCADSVFAAMVDYSPLMGTLNRDDVPVAVWRLYRDAVKLGLLPQVGTQHLLQTIYAIRGMTSDDVVGFAMVDQFRNDSMGIQIEVTSKFNNEQDSQWVSVSVIQN